MTDTPTSEPTYCDCERGHNGFGMVGRLCDCQEDAVSDPAHAPTTGPAICWMGWAIQLHREPWFHVEYGGDEATAWRHALGWPDAEEIAHAKAHGSRAFPVEIREVSR